MLVKGISYGLVLITASALAAGFSIHGKWDPLWPFYFFVVLGSLVFLTVPLQNMSTKKEGNYIVKL
jgi:hypothetical protein